MDIIFILKNIFENTWSLIMYIMPFGIFDSVSYFINLYQNPLFITGIFLLSFILWIVFIIYIFEIFNISVNTDDVAWLRNRDGENKGTEVTFLSETIRFIFWQSNFWTYRPVVVMFFSQLRFKIVPIFVVLFLLYWSFFPTWRWYNTVWEFYFDNVDYIMYQVLWESYISTEEINNKLKYNTFSEENKVQWAYSDKSFLLKELEEDTITDVSLNEALEKEVELYKNVYNKETFDNYVNEIQDKINNKQKQIDDLNNKKDTENLSTNELSNLINTINTFKKEIDVLESDKKNIELAYSTLSYNFDELLTSDISGYDIDLIKKRIEFDINDMILNYSSNKILNDTYNKILEDSMIELNNYIWDSNYEIKWDNDILRNVKSLINSDSISDINKTQYISELVSDVREAKLLWINKENIQQDYYRDKLTQLSFDINNITDTIEQKNKVLEDESARLNYIVTQNENKLLNWNGDNNKDEKQALMLLQYKLVAETNWLSGNFNDTLYLFWNRVEYVWVNVLESFWLVLTIITFIFKMFYYSAIILMAWWKNIFILYISWLWYISRKVWEFIWEDKTISKTFKSHFENLKEYFYVWTDWTKSEIDPKTWQRNYIDKEINWFNENNQKQETYIIMWIEFFLRIAIIYWFLNM